LVSRTKKKKGSALQWGGSEAGRAIRDGQGGGQCREGHPKATKKKGTVAVKNGVSGGRDPWKKKHSDE